MDLMITSIQRVLLGSPILMLEITIVQPRGNSGSLPEILSLKTTILHLLRNPTRKLTNFSDALLKVKS
jgi:hypothetical protein